MKIKKILKHLEKIRLDVVNWDYASPCEDKNCSSRICQAYQKIIKLQKKLRRKKYV